VLIHNAGLWNFSRELSRDDIEEIFAVNFLAPLLMTSELLETMDQTIGGRIIFTSSGLHQGEVNFKDIEFKNSFSGFKAYRQSKLCIMLLTRFLAQKLSNTNLTVNCFHPGVVATDLARSGGMLSKSFFKYFGTSLEKGADTLVYLAESDEVSDISGEYFYKRKVAKSTRESYNMETAKRLMEVAYQYMYKSVKLDLLNFN